MTLGFALAVVGLLLVLASTACFVIVLGHAFRRSLGTGVMVLCIPFFQVVYGFGQFDHPRKGVILGGWLGGFVLGLALWVLGVGLGAR